MPLQEGLDEIVNILTRHYLREQADLIQQYGDQAPDLALEMAEMLDARMVTDTPFGALWEDYQRAPVENEAELMGALEVLEEADPEITIRLEGYLAAFIQLAQSGGEDLVESGEPEATIRIEELEAIKSNDDMDNDDEYREDNTYLTGNVEDHSTSAMYYEGLDTSVEPNETEE